MSKTESFEFLNELALAFRSGENHPRPEYAPVLEGIRKVLAHLTAAGRLIPAGGMALTAEQVEDVEALVATANPYSAPAARLRALFPATEPAEEPARRCDAVSIYGDRCFKTFGHDDDHKAFSYTWDSTYPTPAEPAEEETKAEAFDLNALVRQLAQAGWHERERGESIAGEPCIEWDTQFDWQQQIEYQVVRGILTELKDLGLFAVPASSPVVPAPTETGPWQTWQEVPDGVKYWRGGWPNPTLAYWVNRGGVRFYADAAIYEPFPSDTSGDINLLAPFVAAEEG